MENSHRIVATIGLGSAVLTAVFGIAYIIALFASLAGLLQSPWDMAYQVFPSLLLASAFAVLMVAVHSYAPAERKIWSSIGMAFAIMYATMVSIVYITMLTVVLPHMLDGTADQVSLLLLNSGSVTTAIDGLGYGFMSLSTLFSAFAFAGPGINAWARRTMIAHGVIAIGIVGAIVIPAFLAIGMLWIVTFPAFSLSLALLFRQARKEAGD